MDVFKLRDAVVDEYRRYVESFIRVHDPRIGKYIEERLRAGQLWPDAVLQLNPAFEMDKTLGELAGEGLLTRETARFFGDGIRLYRHQREALDIARRGEPFIVTTGTGSGKSLTYLIPIYEWVISHNPAEHSVRAIIVYPMNALINSQLTSIQKYQAQFPGSPVRFARFTGQDPEADKEKIRQDPPHVLLTNYVMLEYILTRPAERAFLRTATADLQFLVMDEVHFYRGRQGADVAMLLRRLEQKAEHDPLIIGTSATMVSGGSRQERNEAVANVATRLFGIRIKPDNVVDETLERMAKVAAPVTKDELRKAVEMPPPQTTVASVTSHPLAAWAEEAFGLARDGDNRLVRRPPETFAAAVSKLGEQSGLHSALCQKSLRAVLEAGNAVFLFPEQPVFAFRLHQFVSSGSSIFTTLESPDHRHLTMDGQYKTEGERVLYPLAFCRDCGQEYYLVSMVEEGASRRLVPRAPLGGQDDDTEGRAGYFAVDGDNLWEDDDEDLPEFWFEKRKRGWQIKKDYARDRPALYYARTDGSLSESEGAGGTKGWFQPRPLMFCLRCSAAYDRREGEFRKLSSLSQTGRSTATTVMVNATVASMKQQNLKMEEAKVLSFTDNRQDASLQAGHLNDFVQVALLRAGLLEALKKKDPLSCEELGDAIFAAMGMAPGDFLRQPVDSGPGYEQGKRAMMDLLQYRALEDLTRGWRVTQPNLEQVGLLKVRYEGLADLARDNSLWQGLPAIDQATPERREEVLGHVLDELRTSLAIDAEALKDTQTRRLTEKTAQWLRDPWALQRNDILRTQAIMLLPDAVQDVEEKRARVRQLNFRSAIGRYLRNATTWNIPERLSVDEAERLVVGIVDRLAGHILVKVKKHNTDHGVRLLGGALRWTKGDGKVLPPSPLRSRQVQQRRRHLKSGEPNKYFTNLYTSAAQQLHGMVAHEHTGQIEAATRVQREDEFGRGVLPALFCSPTMELGVDIRELYAVHLRNVPPTPANYAQRSGRAGRGGKPALIATFTGQGNAHDQYFFRNRNRMIAGVVEPSRMDINNKELVEAHLHSVWLASVGLSLKNSMNDILDLSTKDYPLRAEIQAELTQKRASIEKATLAAAKELIEREPPLKEAWWYSDSWLDDLVKTAPQQFNAAFARWRELYTDANAVVAKARQTIDNPGAPKDDREEAKHTEEEARREIDLLLNRTRRIEESDFYPYRYLATEGFIPGYNFPRLPVRAFVTVGDTSQSIDRPRFLALSEFGPGNVLYHEGRKYRVDAVVLPAGGIEERLKKARICNECGYIHEEIAAADVCEHCGVQLDGATSDLQLRLLDQPPVRTRSVERILSDEEERIRSGYQVTTHFHFQPGVRVQKAEVKQGDSVLLEISYAPAAQVWRINHGWRRGGDNGFTIDQRTGRWQRRDSDISPDAEEARTIEPLSNVKPFVTDSRNVLLIKPMIEAPSREFLTTLQYAMKRGIQFVYQVEDQEISAELIGRGKNQRILLYEAAEGGTGISELLIKDANMAHVAERALALCHFSPEQGRLTHKAQEGQSCVAACYECLLNYANQNEHRFIDRRVVKDFLTQLKSSQTSLVGEHRSRDKQYEWLRKHIDPKSGLEEKFLQFLFESRLNLPDEAQTRPTPEIQVQTDFFYQRENMPGVCVFLDGPTHDSEEAQQHDAQVRKALQERGFKVVAVRHDRDFGSQTQEHADVFGS